MDIEFLRAEFPVTKRLVYLDIANKTTPPRRVAAAAQAFFERAWSDGGAESYSMQGVEAVRARVARLLGAQAGEIAFVKNTSEGLNIAGHALGVHAGDNVVISSLEHPNLVAAFASLARDGVEVRVAAGADGRPSVEVILACCDERTRAVAVSFVTWAAGHRLDIAALAAAVRPRGITLVVDAIQALGVLDIDVRRLGVDILVAGAHKGLLAVNGIGVLYCRADLIGRLRPAFAARSSLAPGALGSGDLVFADDARRFEFGNPNYLGIHLLGTAIDLIEEIGVPRIEARVRQLTDHLWAVLEAAGRTVRTPREWGERAGIITFDDPNAGATVARLREAGIVVSARGGGVRTSPHFYNTEAELDALVARL